jgi:hypothetical protein
MEPATISLLRNAPCRMVQGKAAMQAASTLCSEICMILVARLTSFRTCKAQLCPTHLIRHVQAWEQVRNDVTEQLHVMRKELWQVAVSHGTNEHHVFWQLWVGALQTASHHKHTFHSTHACRQHRTAQHGSRCHNIPLVACS